MIYLKRAQIWHHISLTLNFEPAIHWFCGLASGISVGRRLREAEAMAESSMNWIILVPWFS